MNTPENTKDKPQQDNPKVYETPQLTEYGTIADITLGEVGAEFDSFTGGVSWGG